MSVAGLKGRISDDRKQRMIARLREASAALSQAMGDL
jgi:DNA-binding IclR family transcriptional regulator